MHIVLFKMVTFESVLTQKDNWAVDVGDVLLLDNKMEVLLSVDELDENDKVCIDDGEINYVSHVWISCMLGKYVEKDKYLYKEVFCKICKHSLSYKGNTTK